MIAGFLNLHKPVGPTSRDVVDLVARPLKRSRVKVGHCGTLDPIAEGVLVVALGPATRLVEHVQRGSKSYRATARLGARSDTLDADGAVVEAPDPPVPRGSAIRAALDAQVGVIQQVPPAFSALRVEGRRAYDLARAGESFDLAARPVTIDRIDLVSYDWPTVVVDVDCGSGTYIRSILRDLGEAVGTGAIMTALVRTRVGPFSIADALDPSTLDLSRLESLVRPPLDALADLPSLALSASDAHSLSLGRSLDAPPGFPPGEVALIGPDGALVAVAELSGGRIAPRKVLVSP